MTKAIVLSVCLVLILFLSFSCTDGGESSNFSQGPAKDMVTLIDFGADQCIPCKMMAPILKELEEEYRGRAAIIFVDVWKKQDQGGKYKVRAIPTQIFFDQNGKEYLRHEGFLDKKSIVNTLEKMGVK